MADGSRFTNVALRAVLVAALVATVTGASRPAGAAVPVPEQDPFYTVPADVALHANGAILNVRPVRASAYSLPLPVHAWQVQYKSVNSDSVATADVTTVLVPLAPWAGRGPRPLLSYQTAEDGVAGKCAPSYALRAGLAGGASNSELETGLIALALLQGWAVTVPDYEGVESAYLGGPGEAHATLDGVRATLAFAPAHISPDAPIGIWGYSGGSIATAEAAQLLPSYAPDVHLAAIALGGLVADIDAAVMKFSGSALGGAIPMGINGIIRAYPDRNLLQYLNDRGRADVTATAGDCINQAAMRYPFLKLSQIEAFPGALTVPAVQDLLRTNSPDGVGTAPTAPVYDYHATFDEFAPVGPDRALMHSYCDAGVDVAHVEDPLTEHISETVAGAPGAVAFLAARFAGRPPTSDCGDIPAP